MELTLLKALILGVLQGLGEFLPISSSGHLALAEHFLGLPNTESMFAFNVLLHLATLLPLVVYFWSDLRAMWSAWARSLPAMFRAGGAETIEQTPEAKWAWLVLMSMVPTGLLALGFHKQVDAIFEHRMWLVSVMLLLAGSFNWYSHRRIAAGRPGRAMERLGWKDAVFCGTAQGCAALFHGISRSGSTMAAGLACGLQGEAAPRFSFLMAAPAVACAALVEVPKLFRHNAANPSVLAMVVAFVAAALSGYWAVATVFRVVRRGNFSGFAWYCWTIGLVTLLLAALGH